MNQPTSALTHQAMATILAELVDGSGAEAAWVLNPRDRGLLRSLEMLSAAAASTIPASGGASIAAHTDHLRYGFQLLNRMTAGENPYADADFSASWRRLTVTESEWAALRSELDREAHAWIGTIAEPGPFDAPVLNGMVASVVHLGYHLGAIRQIDRSIRGPEATD